MHDFKISPRSHIENPPALRTSRLLVGKRSASNTYGTARTEQRDFLQRIRGPPAVDHIGVTLHSELILKVWRRHRCSLVSKRNFARKYAFDSIFEALQDLHPLHSSDLKIFAKNNGMKIRPRGSSLEGLGSARPNSTTRSPHTLKLNSTPSSICFRLEQ